MKHRPHFGRGLVGPGDGVIVRTGARDAPTGGTGSTVTLPAPRAGDVLVVVGAVAGLLNTSPAAIGTLGHTYPVVQATTDFANSVAVWARVADGTETTVSIATAWGGGAVFGWLAYTVKNAAGVDVSARVGQRVSAVPAFPSLTPTGPGLLIDAVCVETGDRAADVTMPAGEEASVIVTDGGANFLLRAGTKALFAGGTVGLRTGAVDVPSGYGSISLVVR